MLSKIESVQTSPSLATLASLAAALEVPVTALFRGMEEEHDAIFVSAGRGIDIEHQAEDRPAGHRSQLPGTMRGPNRLLEPILVTLTKPTEVFPLYQHTGIEIIYMLEGRMEYGTGTARYLLGPGDCPPVRGRGTAWPCRPSRATGPVPLGESLRDQQFRPRNSGLPPRIVRLGRRNALLDEGLTAPQPTSDFVSPPDQAAGPSHVDRGPDYSRPGKRRATWLR